MTVRGPDGEPDAVVVAGVHGDEPSGVRAIKRVRDRDPGFRRTVAFVRANPPALAAGRRYVDADLNRVFPGDPGSDDLERRLAARLCGLVADRPTLSLHATHSQPEPLALVSRDHPRAGELAARLPTPAVVDVAGVVDGSLTTCAPVVTVEAGCQHSDAAADTATRMVEAFLGLIGAVHGDPPAGDPIFYGLDGVVEKPDWADGALACDDVFDLRAGNFERVPAGEELVADEPFVPVLMSECGYRDIFGYRGHVAGETLAEARDHWTSG